MASVINHTSELCAYFFLHELIHRFGHIKILYLGLLGNFVRFVYISIISNPWWVLPFEFIQGKLSSIEFGNVDRLSRIDACGCMGNGMFVFIASSTGEFTHIVSRSFTRIPFWLRTRLWSVIRRIFCVSFWYGRLKYTLKCLFSCESSIFRYRHNISCLWCHMLDFHGHIYVCKSSFS